MANGTFTVLGLQTGLPNGGQNTLGPFTYPFSDVEYDVVLALTTGANTLTPPAGCNGVVLIPLGSNTVTVTLKGATGDTGIALGAIITPTILPFGTVPSSFVLTVSGDISLGVRAI